MLTEILLRVTGSFLSVIIIFFLQFTMMTTIDGICLVICVSFHGAQCGRAFTNTLKEKSKQSGYVLFISTALEKAHEIFFNVVVAIWCLFFTPCDDMLPEILGRHNFKLVSKKV